MDSNSHLLPSGYYNRCILRCFAIYYRSIGGVHACLCWPQGGLSWPESTVDVPVPSSCISKSPVEEGGWFLTLFFSNEIDYIYLQLCPSIMDQA